VLPWSDGMASLCGIKLSDRHAQRASNGFERRLGDVGRALKRCSRSMCSVDAAMAWTAPERIRAPALCQSWARSCQNGRSRLQSQIGRPDRYQAHSAPARVVPLASGIGAVAVDAALITQRPAQTRCPMGDARISTVGGHDVQIGLTCGWFIVDQP